MKIDYFEIITIEVPMRTSVEHALAKRHTARNIIVAARSEGSATGWGECCPRPYVTGETVDSVKRDLSETILPRLLNREFADPVDLCETLTKTLDSLARNQQAAFCAAELAALDWAGQSVGKSAGEVLGPVKNDKVQYSGVIASEDVESVKEHAEFMRKFGVQELKVKVAASLDANREILGTVRSILGDSVSLRIDANCAWTATAAIEQLEELREFKLVGCEQPMAGDDIDGMAKVTAAELVPIVADESLCSLADADILIEKRACDIFNVRISKCGGMINAGRLYRKAVDAGLRCQLGAQVGETGLLSAAGRHFATRCSNIVWLEGSYGKLLLEQDIVDPDITVGPGGTATALDSPGLGVKPVEELLERYATDRIGIGE